MAGAKTVNKSPPIQQTEHNRLICPVVDGKWLTQLLVPQTSKPTLVKHCLNGLRALKPFIQAKQQQHGIAAVTRLVHINTPEFKEKG